MNREFVCNGFIGPDRDFDEVEMFSDDSGKFYLVRHTEPKRIIYEKEVTPHEAAEFYFNHILPNELKPQFKIKK